MLSQLIRIATKLIRREKRFVETNMGMERRQKKAVQAMNYLACKQGGTINRLKLIKLLWLSDKYHLLKYGRTILKDKYVAMPHGPVQSNTLNISLNTKVDYVRDYLEGTKHELKSINTPDVSLFSKSDLEAYDIIWDTFGGLDKYKIRDLSHLYPEWQKFEERLKDTTTSNSYPMDMIDFFILPENPEAQPDIFNSIPQGMQFEAKENFYNKKRLSTRANI